MDAGSGNDGKPVASAEARAKISAGLRRFYDKDPRAEATRRAQSEGKTGEKNPMWGMKHSGETRNKMSLTKTGTVGAVRGEEVKRKISASLKKYHAAKRIEKEEKEREEIAQLLRAARRASLRDGEAFSRDKQVGEPTTAYLKRE